MKGSSEAALLVVGNLNVDRIYRVPSIPLAGQSVPVLAERTAYGGCGGNIAIAASRLGLRTHISSVVGGDLPEDYRSRLKDSGVDMSDLCVIDDKPTPYCVILSAPDGSQIYAFNLGAMGEQASLPLPGIDPSELTFCHVTTSDPGYCLRVLERMSSEGIRTGFDPGQEIFFRWKKEELVASLEFSDRFFGNLQEWRALGDMMGWASRNASPTLPGVMTFEEAFEHIGEAIVTIGSRGAVLMDRKGAIHSKAFGSAVPMDATGAGDAFRGAFYAALARGMPSKEALEIGNIMGGKVISFDGAQEYSVSWGELLSSRDR
ncbi:MAG: carbohydrate kinase family protein [Candidatus Thermoplasmatota archaeon]|nr:carbohydrate kinase family protein [Candidatus Thermoplasmatota archaeon]